MQTTLYEVRQLVRTVKRNWLETIYSSTSDRVAVNAYNTYVAENPKDYFEIVKVTRDEACLFFTAQHQRLPLPGSPDQTP